MAGSLIGINPFNQPDVQAASDRTAAILERGDVDLEPERLGRGALRTGSGRGLHRDSRVHRSRSRTRARTARHAGARDRLRGHGRARPEYLHSTGQLHKGGPNSILALQVVDDLGEELKIPGRKFGFRRLISAQAAGDLEALKERGRRVARVRLEDA